MAMWLQFPFSCEAKTPRKGLVAVASPGARWTCLQLDWHDILLIHLNQRCSHLKSVRLCASLLVQSLYPSDQCFSPVVTVTEAQRAKLPVTPMPREMAFPVPKGESWHDHYAHVRCVVLLSWRPGGGEQGTADADSSSAPAEVSKPQLRSTSAARSEERFPCGGSPARPTRCPGPFRRSACPVSTQRPSMQAALEAAAKSRRPGLGSLKSVRLAAVLPCPPRRGLRPWRTRRPA